MQSPLRLCKPSQHRDSLNTNVCSMCLQHKCMQQDASCNTHAHNHAQHIMRSLLGHTAGLTCATPPRPGWLLASAAHASPPAGSFTAQQITTRPRALLAAYMLATQNAAQQPTAHSRPAAGRLTCAASPPAAAPPTTISRNLSGENTLLARHLTTSRLATTDHQHEGSPNSRSPRGL